MKKSNKQMPQPPRESLPPAKDGTVWNYWSEFLLPIKPEWLLIFGLVLYLAVSVCTVKDYGMNVDSVKNYQEGKANLDFLLTGQMDWNVLQEQMHGALFVMVAEVSKRLLHDLLGLYDPVSARQITLPFLTAIFLFFLFRFVQRRWDGWHGLVAVGFLLTYPYFWESSFNNQKDIPLLVFFSVSVMSFADWVTTHKLRYFYGFFIFLGCALAIKLQALMVPALILLWLVLKPRNGDEAGGLHLRRSILHATIGFCIAMAIFLAFYAPMFWGVENKMSSLFYWQDHVKSITTDISKPFNLKSFRQIYYQSPIPILFLFCIGMISAIWFYRRNTLYSLLLVWVFLPVIIPCLPSTVIYSSGLRLFLMFIVPFTLFAALGLFRITDFLAQKTGKSDKLIGGFLAAMVIGVNLYGVVETHPYQSTFFNKIVGGLGGAQVEKLPDACDDRLTSYKAAGRWLRENANFNATVLALGTRQQGFAEANVGRPDLHVNIVWYLPSYIEPNTYIIYVPRDMVRLHGLILAMSLEFENVYKVTRQGGVILAIYYKKP